MSSSSSSTVSQTADAAALVASIRRDIEQFQQQHPDEHKDADSNAEVTGADIEKFLNYGCNYKKYKGMPWRDVLVKDKAYFDFVVGKYMNPSTKTWRILSVFLSPEERAAALLRPPVVS